MELSREFADLFFDVPIHVGDPAVNRNDASVELFGLLVEPASNEGQRLVGYL